MWGPEPVLIERVVDALRKTLPAGETDELKPRIGIAGTHFAATIAAVAARPGDPMIVPPGDEAAFLADRPSGLLTTDPDIRARLMTGFGADVYVEADRLMLRLLSPIPSVLRGLELHPDSEADPDVFRLDLARFELPTARIVFTRSPDGPATAMHLDIFPMSLRRRPPAPRGLKAWHLVAFSTALSVVATLVARRLWRRPT